MKQPRVRRVLASHGPAADPVASFRGVTKRFPDGTDVLGPIDLTLAAGELVGVLGPSGCGKSTLLRIMAGLLDATEGLVRAPGDGIGYVFQDPTLLPWRSVQRNVELLGELRGRPSEERRRRAQDVLELVGLADFAGHLPGALSAGMRMRVSLARALMMDPTLLLLDEPFGALDELTRERLGDELLRLFAAERFAALFVTHSVTEAVYLASRVVVLSSRPARIVGEFDVPFGYPRAPGLRFDPGFTQLAANVSSCLRDEVA